MLMWSKLLFVGKQSLISPRVVDSKKLFVLLMWPPEIRFFPEAGML